MMSLDEIAYWLKRLIEEPELGWSEDLKLLSTYLGFSFAFAVKNRAYGKTRMAKREQVEVSDLLQEIINGRVTCERRRYGDKIRGKVVISAHPVPIHVPKVATGFVSVGKKGVKLSLLPPKFEAPVSKLPSFKQLSGG